MDETRSMPPMSKIMETSTQINSNNFSLIQADESLKSVEGAKSFQQKSLKSVQTSVVNVNGSIPVGENPLAASVIMGDTKSSLFQTFPSLMQSSMPIDEVQALQQLTNEHGQMKESLQKANVAMRQNFSNIQKWQNEVKVKYSEQVRTIDEQCATIDGLTEENKTLKQALALAETRAREQEKRLIDDKTALQMELDLARKQIQAERTAAGAELDELRKAMSEKLSIVQNMAKEIERLELEKQEFVVIKPNKPESSAELEFINKAEHDRQIKVLQREMSVVVANNLQFEDMKQMYVDELNCLKVNLTAAEELHAKYRSDLSRQAKELETKNVEHGENIRELKTLSEQVDVLTAQLEIYKTDFEAERSARAELASEKDRILSDLKLLQKRNQQLIEEVQNGRSAEESATRAANESLDKRASPEASTSAEPVEEEQKYERAILHCPLCQKGYKDIATLQNHVEDCVGE